MPAPAGMQRPRHATGATLPADAHDTADGAALLPAIASTEGASGQIQMQAGPNACCDLPQTEHTLPDRPAGSAMLSGPRQLRAAPPSARHLHLVPPTALAAPSQELLSAGQAATAVRLGHDARLQQHLQPDHSFHTEFAEAATGSTQPLEQPTASTGTSRPDPQWFPGKQALNTHTPHWLLACQGDATSVQQVSSCCGGSLPCSAQPLQQCNPSKLINARAAISEHEPAVYN